jgi:hypothetical protein
MEKEVRELEALAAKLEQETADLAKAALPNDSNRK